MRSSSEALSQTSMSHWSSMSTRTDPQCPERSASPQFLKVVLPTTISPVELQVLLLCHTGWTKPGFPFLSRMTICQNFFEANRNELAISWKRWSQTCRATVCCSRWMFIGRYWYRCTDILVQFHLPDQAWHQEGAPVSLFHVKSNSPSSDHEVLVDPHLGPLCLGRLYLVLVCRGKQFNLLSQQTFRPAALLLSVCQMVSSTLNWWTSEGGCKSPSLSCSIQDILNQRRGHLHQGPSYINGNVLIIP